MKYEIIRYRYEHNDLILDLANGADIFTEATANDLKNLDAGKRPVYWNERKNCIGSYDCWIDWE